LLLLLPLLLLRLLLQLLATYVTGEWPLQFMQLLASGSIGQLRRLMLLLLLLLCS
jgi:hypothetical protein